MAWAEEGTDEGELANTESRQLGGCQKDETQGRRNVKMFKRERRGTFLNTGRMQMLNLHGVSKGLIAGPWAESTANTKQEGYESRS